MDFSVIIPTFNEEKYIRRCLESIIGQDYDRSKFEIIVADANSTDDTVGISDRFANKVIVDQRRGISYGRNLGAKHATGDILVFVDADAILNPDFLNKTNALFSDNKYICMTGIAKPADGKFLPKFVYISTYKLVSMLNLLGLSLFPGVCVAYRRDIFLSLGGFRDDFGIVEDLDLSRRTSKHGKCFVNHNALAYVSTRRLEKHMMSTVLFHIFNDIRYLLTGKAPAVYPKSEEIHAWTDMWKNLKSKKN